MDDIQKSEPKKVKFISLAEASRITGYHQDYLGYLARVGKLDAQKIARNWVTTPEALTKLEALNIPTDNIPPAGQDFSDDGAAAESGEAAAMADISPSQKAPVKLPIQNPQPGMPVLADGKLLSLKKNVIDSIARKAASDSIEMFIEKKYNDLQKRNLDGLAKNLKKEMSSYIEERVEHSLNEKFKKHQVSFDHYEPHMNAPKTFSGIDKSLATPALNLKKINQSFNNRHRFEKFVIAFLLILVIALGAALWYTYSKLQGTSALNYSEQIYPTIQNSSVLPVGGYTDPNASNSIGTGTPSSQTFFDSAKQNNFQNSTTAQPGAGNENANASKDPATQKLFSGQVSNPNGTAANAPGN